MASALDPERGATLLSHVRNSSIESSYRQQAASSVISPLRTAATTAALRRLVHLVTGDGGSIICFNSEKYSRGAIRMSCRPLGGTICAAGRTHTASRARCDTAGVEERGNRDLIFS